MLLDKFKHFDLDQEDLDEIVELSAFGRSLRAEYEALQLDVPDWVSSQLKVLQREARARNADAIEKQLRQAKAKLETLKPAEQKREETQKEIERLEALLQK